MSRLGVPLLQYAVSTYLQDRAGLLFLDTFGVYVCGHSCCGRNVVYSCMMDTVIKCSVFTGTGLWPRIRASVVVDRSICKPYVQDC